MKFFFATVFLFLIACNNAEKKETVIMPGAYLMLSQSVKSNEVDTTYHTLQQLKIYTGEYMMYASFYPRDSVSTFGVGSYTADKDTVTENVIYRASDSIKNDTPTIFTLLITKTDGGYKQVIPESQGQKVIYTEEYSSVGTTAKTPLDGVWKELKTFYVKGKDTTKYNTNQYKAYYAGNFIYGFTFSDSAKKVHTGMGYGQFIMNGANKVKETSITSSYAQNRGRDIDIDVEMNGDDEFKQTINYPNGGKTIEVYQRLRKP